jgi:predicted ABC-type transport system involved in lysophospholipase L1 biosynthesis ATPase subunit
MLQNSPRRASDIENCYDLIKSPVKFQSVKSNYLHFDVSYAIKEKDGKAKLLLNHISDIVQSGESLAIMGPSGKHSSRLGMGFGSELTSSSVSRCREDDLTACAYSRGL